MESTVFVKRQWFISSKHYEISSEYDLGVEIGSGGYGKVFLAMHKMSKILRAVKIINKAQIKQYETFITELEILKNLDHPNIVNIIETFETETVCYVVLEHCAGGELFERLCKIKRFTELQAAKIMKSLISAVMYCHNHGICHRDIKPENCLFINTEETSDIKIIDFGLSAVVTEEEILHDMYGTPYYIAPEMLNGNYTKVVDCWSLGVLLYMLLSGTPPFNGKSNSEILMSVYNGSFTFRPKPFKTVSDSAKDLIVRFLTKDPAYRITAEQAFMHPWIQELMPTQISAIPDSVILSFASFMRASPFKRVTLSFIATKLSGGQLEKLRKLFKGLDTNGDGVISKQEFSYLVQNSSNLTLLDIETVCRYLDTNMNGTIDYNEFLAGSMIKDSFNTDEWIQLAFDYFDKDRNGFISRKEFKGALAGEEIAISWTKEEIARMLHNADLNNDGVISFEEFKQLLLNSSQSRA